VSGVTSQAPGTDNLSLDSDHWSLADSWIQARLRQLVREVERLFQSFQYGEAGRQIYEFIWSDFADWYVEIAKEQLKNEETKAQTVEILARVLDTALRLLHPYTPFVTEELWGHLRNAVRNSLLFTLAADWSNALIVAQWPEPHKPEDWEEDALQNSEKIQGIVRSIRNARIENNIKPSDKFRPILVNDEDYDLLQENSYVIAGLTGTLPPEIFRYIDSKPENHLGLVSSSTDIYLPLTSTVDLAEKKSRLEKDLKEAQSQIERLEKLLAGDFASKAPAHLVEKEREKLASYQETAEKIKAQLK
jgi:valyl-tRNA synthetase